MALPRVLPLTAVVGAEEAKAGLLALAANPSLSGLLLRGAKGTGKSTLARGLAALLPETEVNEGCPFGCRPGAPETWCDGCREGAPPRAVLRPAPFVTLPLGATEDQVAGTVDLERALGSRGELRLQPGLLARASGGVLYVDEVNLLDDHLVDLLLDAAASKVNVVAREGLQLSHPADFLLVGTMNPEEGELRPQLLDRFGLAAELSTERDPAARAEIVERVLAFEAAPAAYAAEWAEAERSAAESILQARRLLVGRRPEPFLVEAAGSLSLALEVDGHRADLLLVKAAMTLAALDGRVAAEQGDIERAAPLVYRHRLRRRPFDDEGPGVEAFRERIEQALAPGSEKKAPGPD